MKFLSFFYLALGLGLVSARRHLGEQNLDTFVTSTTQPSEATSLYFEPREPRGNAKPPASTKKQGDAKVPTPSISHASTSIKPPAGSSKTTLLASTKKQDNLKVPVSSISHASTSVKAPAGSSKTTLLASTKKQDNLKAPASSRGHTSTSIKAPPKSSITKPPTSTKRQNDSKAPVPTTSHAATSTKSPSKASSAKPSSSTKSQGEVKAPVSTTSHLSTSTKASSEASHTQRARGPPAPKKCTPNGSCGGQSCSSNKPRSDLVIRSYPITASKRTFTPWSQIGTLKNSPNNHDITFATDWFTDWIKFANKDASATAFQLIGCSVIIAYSEEGFQSLHMFEGPDFDGASDDDESGGEDIGREVKSGRLFAPASDTLYPGNGGEFMRKKLEDVWKAIDNNKSKWGKNPRVALLMPREKDVGWRYDSNKIYEWQEIMTKAGVPTKQKGFTNGMFDLVKGGVPPPEDTSRTIISTFEENLGVKLQLFGYEVAKGGSTWALQYSPDQNGKQQIQMWADGKELLVGEHEYKWAKKA